MPKQVIQKRKFLLYVGNDLPDLLIANKIIPQMIDLGVTPVLLFAKKPKLKNPDTETPAMRELGFYHNRLLQETIIPFLDSKEPFLDARGNLRSDIFYTPRQLADYYGLERGVIDNVNAPDHVKAVRKDKDIMGALSIRCMQIFKENIISAHKEKGEMLNLHPGKLPGIRGVLPIFRAMAAGDKNIIWTLHSIDIPTKYSIEKPFIDTGVKHGKLPQTIEEGKSVFYHYNSSPAGVAALFVQALENIVNGIPLDRFVQDRKKQIHDYYSYPDQKVTDAFNRAGGLMIEQRAKMIQFFGKTFAGGGSPHRRELNFLIEQAIKEEFDQPVVKSSSRRIVQPFQERRVVDRRKTVSNTNRLASNYS